jgi:hypothetical protein
MFQANGKLQVLPLTIRLRQNCMSDKHAPLLPKGIVLRVQVPAEHLLKTLT